MNHTPGPWRWQGEDYRGGWGWQMLVGPNGEGLIVGQDADGIPSSLLRGFMPVDPKYCITGMAAAEGKERANCVHVMEADAHLIAAAPDLLETLKEASEWIKGELAVMERSSLPEPNEQEAEDLTECRELVERAKAAISKAEHGA